MGYLNATEEETRQAREAMKRHAAEIEALRKDALLGRFVRLHMTECHGGWAIAQTFIPGAPSIEDVTDAIDPKTVAAMLMR